MLVTGGSNQLGPVSTSELYDAAANVWRPLGDMAYARAGHTATLLNNGGVVIAGGTQLHE